MGKPTCGLCGQGHPTEIHEQYGGDHSGILAPRQERIAHLVGTTQELSGRFGFAEGANVPLDSVKEQAEGMNGEIEGVLRSVYTSEKPEQAETLATSSDVRLAYVMNVQKMVQFGRMRKDGSPYYTHPQSVSQRFVEFAPDDAKTLKEGVIGAVLHDYLEEGDGVTRESVGDLRQAFEGMGREYAEQLAMLTEPYYVEGGKKEHPELEHAVDYDRLKALTGKDKKVLESLTFGIMMERAPLMQLVVPVDKLDNVGDCDLVQRKKVAKDVPDSSSPEYRKKLLANLAKTVGTFAFYAQQCTAPEAAQSRAALEGAIVEKVTQLSGEFPELEAEMKKVAADFETLKADKKVNEEVRKELEKYYRTLGADSAADRFRS